MSAMRPSCKKCTNKYKYIRCIGLLSGKKVGEVERSLACKPGDLNSSPTSSNYSHIFLSKFPSPGHSFLIFENVSLNCP